MSEFEQVETDSELYVYTGDAKSPGKATQAAKKEFADENDVPFDEVIGTKLSDSELRHVGDGEFESYPGPVIAVFHEPVEAAKDVVGEPADEVPMDHMVHHD